MKEFTEIESKYFDLAANQISLKEFEIWVYNSDFLEKELDEGQYLDLISLNYNNPSSVYDLNKILSNKIDFGKFEENRLIKLLNSIANRDGNEAQSLISCYDLYCKGYYFFEGIGLGFGLSLLDSLDEYAVEPYRRKLTQSEKKNLLDSVYPAAKELAIELIQWIEEGKIKCTGKQDKQFNRWEYVDERNEKEKESRVWKVSDINPLSNEILSKENILIDENGDFKK